MKHYLRFLITMLLLVLFGGGSFGQTWQKVELKDLTSDDVFVIAEVHDLKYSYAMSNNNGTSAPTAVRITLSEDGTTITSAADGNFGNLEWNVGKSGDAYVFYPNGNKKKWLYCTKTENVLKVGTGSGKTFKLYKDNNYSGLKNITYNRYIGVFNKKDWRSYTTVHDNIKGQQIAFYKYVDDTRTATNVTFGADVDGKPFYVTEGEESSFSGKIATEKDGVAGTIKYSSNNKDVVSVDETTGVVKFGKTFGTATITALFTPTDDVTYKESSASYTINYIEKDRIATTLAFVETEGSVKLGETFTLPELTLTTADGKVLTGKTFTYTSSAPEVASIDKNTGEVKILSAGNTILTATFEDSEDKYKPSTAEFALKVIDPNVIVFSAADKSFGGLRGYDDSENEVTFISASGEPYSFIVRNCMKGTGDVAGLLQMKSDAGYVTSPSFETSFPYGYKVAVYYTTGKTPEDLTISSNSSPEVKSTTVKSGGGTTADPEYVTTISLSNPSATFKMTANFRVKYVSRIELTPLAAPKTVVLDEENNNDKVVEDYAGKTVNVTLKRKISDTYLNPFCVPFDMTADQITAVFGEGSVVSAFTSVTGKVMNFGKVATITAGQPYIVQATKASTEISLDNVEMKFEPGSNVKQKSDELSMSFNGIVSPYTFKKNDGTELFLDKEGNLRYPSAVPSKMKGMRAYFEVLGGTGNEAKVNIGGGLSSIDKLMNGEAMTGKVYNLNGQYVGNTLDGLAKGLYIMNGKKYVVK